MNKKKIALAVPVLLGAVIIYFAYSNYDLAVIGAGYKAKNLCSEIFVAGRDAEEVLSVDLKHPLSKYFSEEIDYTNKTVTISTAFGLVSQTAYYREGLGVTLNLNEQNQKESLDLTSIYPQDFTELPTYGKFPEGIDSVQLIEVVQEAFTEPDTNRSRRTRAVLLIYDNKILVEHYAEGFNKNTYFCGWSMTKSVTNALIGLLVKDDFVSLEDFMPIEEWYDDERSKITYNDMLRMTPGLEFEESYKNLTSDVMQMLYASKNSAAYAYSKPLIHAPGAVWNYSTGTTNVLAYAFKKVLRQNGIDDKLYPYQKLFYKTGMTSTLLEYDASGTFLGGTGMYAVARDWGKFGLLYLHKGVWKGEKILPDGWVEYSSARNPDSRKGKHTAHFWVKSILEEDDENYKYMTRLPEDMLYATGHYGQYVMIIPSYKLVVVRLGFTRNSDDWNQFSFLISVINCFRQV